MFQSGAVREVSLSGWDDSLLAKDRVAGEITLATLEHNSDMACLNLLWKSETRCQDPAAVPLLMSSRLLTDALSPGPQEECGGRGLKNAAAVHAGRGWQPARSD